MAQHDRPTPQALSARERILSTAHDLFYAEGIRATGVDRVISEAGVTKVTFYRHFPSKDDLVLAFLSHRHERWMVWFRDALERHGGHRGKGAAALVPALAEWFGDARYRGCAFLNSVGELGGALPDVVSLTREHKGAMTQAIADVLPASRHRARDADMLSMAVDGAILRAQHDSADAALRPLARWVRLLQA
jgi:AcrR family transcriptional regulator